MFSSVKWSGALLASCLLAVTGCTPGTSGSGPTAVDGPAKSVIAPQSEDAAFAAQVQAVGFDSGTAAFAQLTKSTLEVDNGHTFVVRQAFANNASAATAYHLFASGGGVPGNPPKLTFTKAEDGLRYTFSYTIATNDLPADLRAQVLAGLPSQAPSQAQRDSAVAALIAPEGGLRLPADTTPSTIDVVVDGVISQANETGIDKAIETAKLDKTHAGTSWEAFKAGKKVWDAIEANELIADALTRINAARDCAANPTNPVTIKEYQENPGAKQKLLDQVDQEHDEVTANAMVAFLGMFTDTAGGLLKAAPWLGFITGPAVNYMKETLGSVINDRVRAAEQLVPKCEKASFSATGGGNEWSASGTICDLAKPFTLSGSGLTMKLTPSGSTGGQYTLSGNAAGVSWKGSGTYTVKRDRDGASGTLETIGTNTIDTPRGTYSGTAKASFALTRIDSCGG
ncbi:MAG: hypothetical protein L6256_04815 [Propionicimonas sp.]|uniref:hypothetical protein n=1 Tax=Propionicimonas sp. TaxID=1955623 RepID=UPI001E0DB5E6|nr:hypothetical protein [Propionicimonas sp.]MBU4189046.1 hypothetical protein [Actinomycetota bacterium]MBU4206882.1 hypothetical protein [Actinomycetota bacterium]MBU4249904.1 hypothetical protein [Actinomycetota bacterium]MBU4363552.1 hypothetical protein [Actinomycetota bacterium]MBU4410004.1 hypothetical protein [Actinomycetota bacterium]